MKQVFLSTVIALLFVLSAGAQTQSVHLPTTAYRTEGSNEIRVNYTYDSNGRVASEHRYLKKADGNYILVDSIARAYHQLPSGKFTSIKDEVKRKNIMPEVIGRDEETGRPMFGNEYRYDLYSHYNETAAYDAKGMQLWSQNGSSIEVAILDENDIRTDIHRYNNGEIYTDSERSYTFDDKGRVVEYSYEYDSYYNGYSRTTTYTWGDNDMITSFSESYEARERDGDEVNISSGEYSYNNIVTVLNEEYFEPYSLSPIQLGESDERDGNLEAWERAPLSFTDIQKYAWDDYTLRQCFFNMDISGTDDGEQISATWRTVVDNAKGEIAIIIALDGVEAGKQIYEKLPYGGYKHSAIEDGDTTRIQIMEYNQYGALVRDYSYRSYEDYYDYTTRTEINDRQYTRQYDTQGRPIKTVYSYKSKYDDGDYSTPFTFEETYNAWTSSNVEIPEDNISSIKPAAVSTVSVYPNPVTDILYIKAENPQSKLYNQQGQLLLQTSESQINFTLYPAGIYILDVNGERIKVVK